MYSPLHRDRKYDSDRRKLLKYTSNAVWYTPTKFGDDYKDGWKAWIVTKQKRRQMLERKNIKWWQIDKGSNLNKQTRNQTTTVMFVPKTVDGKLLDQLQVVENELACEVGWSTKLVEKPGTPLLLSFITWLLPRNRVYTL